MERAVGLVYAPKLIIPCGEGPTPGAELSQQQPWAQGVWPGQWKGKADGMKEGCVPGVKLHPNDSVPLKLPTATGTQVRAVLLLGSVLASNSS